jgi:hypothetical protein
MAGQALFALLNADNVPMEETALCAGCAAAGKLPQAREVARSAGDWDGSDDLRKLENTEELECLVCCYRPSQLAS